MNLIHLADKCLDLDALIRVGIRRLLAKRRRQVWKANLTEFTRLLPQSPLAGGSTGKQDAYPTFSKRART